MVPAIHAVENAWSTEAETRQLRWGAGAGRGRGPHQAEKGSKPGGKGHSSRPRGVVLTWGHAIGAAAIIDGPAGVPQAGAAVNFRPMRACRLRTGGRLHSAVRCK